MDYGGGEGTRKRGCSCSLKQDFLPEKSFQSWGNYGRALWETSARLKDRVMTRSLDSAELEAKARSNNQMKKTMTWWDTPLAAQRPSVQSHPWLAESDRELLCRLIDCQKLSLEACTHAAQNERLPLRIIVQVLFFEQLQLRTSIAGCFLVSDNLDGSRQLRSGLVGSTEGEGGGGGWVTAVRENQVLKVGMDSMRMRVSELEKECSNMRREIEKLGKGKVGSGSGSGSGSSIGTWEGMSKKFGFKIRSQMCSAQEGSVSNQINNGGRGKSEKGKDKLRKHKKI